MKISKKTVYKNKWFQIIDNHYIETKKNYFTIQIPDSSVILPITTDEEFIIIKQYRETLNNYSLELPAGFIEKDENPIDTAKRELFEETGYKSNIFVAKEAIKKSEPKEKNIKVVKLSQSKLFDLIDKDKFVQLSGQGLILKYLIHNKKI